PDADTSMDAEIKQRQKAWQRAHPNTVKFWGCLNRAAIQAVRKPNIVMPCGRVAFEYNGTFLRMRLPSGRKLAYPFPQLRADDRGNLAVVFMDNAGGKWAECRRGHGAYGGTWIENAVQAVARDLFAAAMPRLEAAGYRIVLHVHDEIVAEVPDGFGSAEEFLQILTTAPAWAEGLPIAAKVREGSRFCKITKPQPQLATSTPAATELDEPSCPAAPVMAQRAATNATPEPEILQQNSQSAPPWVEAPASGPQPVQQIEGRETMERVDPTRGGNGDARDLPHVNGAPPIAPAAAPHSFADEREPGNGGENSYPHGERRAGRCVATYLYCDYLGGNHTEVKKMRAPRMKRAQYPQRFWVNGQWVSEKPTGWLKIPYRLPEMLAAITRNPEIWVFGPEGEKDCETLVRLGLVATTNSEGATPPKAKVGKWTPELNRWFHGVRHLIITADNDEVERRFTEEKARALESIVPDICIVHFPDPPPGEDVTR